MKNSLITNYFEQASSITITNNGQESSFQKGDDKFESVLNSLELITKKSHELPAFSVALDGETRTVKQSGLWLELNFNTEQTHNEMPFESLLIEVNSKHSGFNLIRKQNGVYDGRCFYLDLNGNMSHLETTILNILKT